MGMKGSDGDRRKTAVKKFERWAEGWKRGSEEDHEPGGAAHAGGRAVAQPVLRICGFDYDDWTSGVAGF